MPQLGKSELMSLVRRGAQTLVHPEVDVDEMLGWDWETTLEKCKQRDVEPDESKTETQPGLEDSEKAEQKWLSSMERVESYVLDGKRYAKHEAHDYGGIRAADANLDRAARREGKNVTVMVDGFAIDKKSLLCADWEAVPTLAGKDPRLAEPKREKKAAMVNQDVSRGVILPARARDSNRC